MKSILVSAILSAFVSAFALNSIIIANDSSITESRSYTDPIWSKDGNFIAFITIKGNKSNLIVVSADGSKGEVLFSADKDILVNPDWSPDSTKLAFIYQKVQDFGDLKIITQSNIYIVNRDGSELFNVTGSNPELVDRVNTRQQWSPDGNQLSFSSERENSDTWIVNFKDMSFKNLTSNSNAISAYSSWSPDGKSLAYIAYDKTEIYIHSLISESTTTLELPKTPSYLAWSPNGASILIQPFEGNMFLLSVADGLTHELNLDGTKPLWSPDGAEILVEALPGISLDDINSLSNWDIMKFNIQENKLLNLTTTNTSKDISASWSPDGTQIVFISDRDGFENIWIMNSDGTGQHILTGDLLIDNAI
ncbi:MAG: hypothetical protein ABI690_26410 [Chloroflexota bacterium]